MGTFLQIIGGLFLSFIILIFIAAFAGKFFLRRKLQQMHDEIQKSANGRVYEHDESRGNNDRGSESQNVIDVEFEVKDD